jgi:hypothetical protein
MSTTDLTIFTDTGFSTTLKIAETLVKSGVLPRGIDNPFKAFAIIQKGREIGVGPMRALTGIALIEGKPTVSPELKLEQFRQRGGHVKWVKSDNFVAHIHLKAPNGDEHEEIVTLDDMKMAGVAGKDNWRKYPKSMLRARCVGFGLRALGEGDGSYTPDELGAVTNESGEVEYAPPMAQATTVEVVADEGPKANTAAAATPATTAASAPQSGPTTKAARANTIKHDGTFANHKQVALLHILKSKIGGMTEKCDCYDADGKRINPVRGLCLYHKQLAAFKDCDGRPITTSTNLSEDQISNLIGRYEAQTKKQEARAAEGFDTGAVGIPPNVNLPPHDDSLDEVRSAVDGKDDPEACLNELCEVFRCPTLADLPKHEAPAALALVLAYGTAAYPTVLERVRP